MKILISNDDGVHSVGLAVLAEHLSALAQITVVAPDRDRSGASNSLTLDRPLQIVTQPNGFYAINGTPTDCVHVAITGALDQHPDMIVSGINTEANLGDDVLYSGTVAAAMEGRFLGYPAMAISLVKNSTQQERYYDSAARVACVMLKKLIAEPLPKETILNINVPDLPWEAIKGFQVTRMGHRHIAEPVIESIDPRGRTIYWIGPSGPEQDAGEGTDFYAIRHGFVSVTPLKVDFTDYSAMKHLSEWVTNMSIGI